MFKTGGEQHGDHHAVSRRWWGLEVAGTMISETKETICFKVYQNIHTHTIKNKQTNKTEDGDQVVSSLAAF